MAAGLLVLLVALLAPAVIEGARPSFTLAYDVAHSQRQLECSQALVGFKLNILSPLAPIPKLEELGYGRMLGEADAYSEQLAVLEEDDSYLRYFSRRSSSIKVVCMGISGT